MPARAPATGQKVAGRLAKLGERMRTHRKALRISATTAAEAAGVSRVTLHRIEKGEPSVTMGAYLAAINALGLDIELVDPASEHARPGRMRAVPRRIAIADFPQLRHIAWQLGDDAKLTPKEALALYERNWRHVERTKLSEPERELIRSLVDALGGARLLV